MLAPEDITALSQETELLFSSHDFKPDVYNKLFTLTLHATQKENPALNIKEQTKQAKQDAVKLTLLFGHYDKAIEYLKAQETNLAQKEEPSKIYMSIV